MMPFGHVTCERPVIDTQVGLLGRGLQSSSGRRWLEIQTWDALALK